MQQQTLEHWNSSTLNSATSNSARLNSETSNSATSKATSFTGGASLFKKELLWQLNNMLLHNCKICCSRNFKLGHESQK